VMTKRPWLPIVLLFAAILVLGPYPADRASVAAVRRGDGAAAERRYGEALRAYELAVQRCPGCPQPHLRRGAVYVAQGRYEEAQAAYLDATRLGGLNDDAMGGLAALHAAENSERLAIGELEHLLARRPGRGDGWLRLGEVYLAAEDPGRARQAFERALSLDIPAEQRQAVHDQLGVLCLALDGVERGAECALEHWTEVERGPDVSLAESAARLVQALRLLVQPDKSVDPALAQARLGEALYRRGALDLARRPFEAALALEPGYVDAHAYLGHVLSLLGQHQAAVDHLERAIALEPAYTLPRYFLGMHYVRLGWWVTGRDVLEQAHDLDPADPAICAAVADTYLRGDAPWYDVAEQWLQAAVERAPADPRFHLLLAHFYVDRAIDPGVRGVAAARAAVDLAPESSEAHETLGWAYHLGGQSALALEPLLRALEGARYEPRVHYRLGEAYRALDQPEQARPYLQMAIDLDWYGPIGERARQSLALAQELDRTKE
jgi:tetratricopeptide (TPR) repeat protein